MSILNRSKERQEKYWTERSERVILEAEKSQAEMFSDLANLYDESAKAIQREIEAFYGRYSIDIGVTFEEAKRKLNKAEMKSYKSQTQEYYDAIKASDYAFDPAYRERLSRQLSLKSAVSRLEALQSDAQYQMENLYAEIQSTFKASLGSAYEDAYYQTIFDLQKGIGYGSPFDKLNAKLIEKAVAEKWLGDNYSGRIWKDKDRLQISLEKIIPSGIALGQNPREIGKEIASQLNVRKSSGERLARTEFNKIANDATYDGYTAAGVERYQFLATLDNRTSEECGAMDGEIFELKDKMIGINWPPLHPNCRSTTIPYFEDSEVDKMIENGERIAKTGSKRTYYVPSDMTYKEWAKEHI